MLQRVIPIRPLAPPPWRPGMAAAEPRLSGETGRLEQLLGELDDLACSEFGTELPRGAWLRELHLHHGEAVLSLAPALRAQGGAFAQAAFELLKSALRDTDIYVRTAQH